MLVNLDNVVVTVGDIVIRGSLTFAGVTEDITITLQPDRRLTLDEVSQLIGEPGAVDDTAAKQAIEDNKKVTDDLQVAETENQV